MYKAPFIYNIIAFIHLENIRKKSLIFDAISHQESLTLYTLICWQ